MDVADLDDLVLVIAHPHGDVEVPWRVWADHGPGPRPLVRPVSARRATTGAAVPLTAIPVAYRNDDESRRLIRDGLIRDPWATAR